MLKMICMLKIRQQAWLTSLVLWNKNWIVATLQVLKCNNAALKQWLPLNSSCIKFKTYLIVATVFNQINTVQNTLLYHEREIISHTVATLIQDTWIQYSLKFSTTFFISLDIIVSRKIISWIGYTLCRQIHALN